jgi:hypothetical protein
MPDFSKSAFVWGGVAAALVIVINGKAKRAGAFRGLEDLIP